MSGGVLTPSFWCVVYVLPECRLILAGVIDVMAFRAVNDPAPGIVSNDLNRGWQRTLRSYYFRADTLRRLFEEHDARITECNRHLCSPRDRFSAGFVISRLTRDDRMLDNNYRMLIDATRDVAVDGRADRRTLTYFDQYVNVMQRVHALSRIVAGHLMQCMDNKKKKCF